MVTTGPTLTDVLQRAWQKPFAVQSNFARENAGVVGVAASEGLITTKIAAGLFSRQWTITIAGLRYLEIMEGLKNACATEKL